MRKVTAIAVGLVLALGAATASAAAPTPAPVWPGHDWQVRRPSLAVDSEKLTVAIDIAMANGLATRAIVVIEDGAIVAERYADGYGADTKFFSYSMAKSFTSTLVGILVGEGRLDIHARAPVPEWSAANDPRRAIRLIDLLHMSSGLATNERYTDSTSDVATMLFGAGRTDVAHHAADHPLKYRPGSYYSYSNSTSNVISGIIRRTVGDDEASYRGFMERSLFVPLGMRDTVAGFDARGTFVGSSFISATARDYARFGLLYMRGGEWNGKRILPESWVRFVRTPAPSSGGIYGGHFFLGPSRDAVKRQPPIAQMWPADAFSARGLFGQMISISPCKRLVVVILGHTQFLPEDDRSIARERQVGNIFSTVGRNCGADAVKY